MTAVANPPSFSNLSRPAWGVNGGQPLNAMNSEEVRGMFAPRKPLQRTNSASSIASNSSIASGSSVSTVVSAPSTNGNGAPPSGDLSAWPNAAARKRPQPKGQWPAGKTEGQPEVVRMAGGRPPMSNGMNGVAPMHQQSQIIPGHGQMMSQSGMPRPGTEALATGGQPVLYLLSLNGTFERKTISVPYYPETLRIGRQTNAKTVPTPVNGFFDSKVLSRQHAEIWADRNGKIWIRDVKSSNGTFVNGSRLSQENRESEPHELQTQDHLELGIDIVSEDQKTVVHHKVAAKVEHAGYVPPSSSLLDMNFGDLDPSNGGMMIPLGGMPHRARSVTQASMNGRLNPAAGMMGAPPNGMAQQRQFWLNPITMEHIVKRLQNEMRNARLQSQDLNRTGHFIGALLSKEDVKNQDKPEAPEPPKPQATNGNGISFRSDGGKPRFSDPPLPPPSQPLPEKPSDLPSLKRATTERPKSHPPPSNTSPIRQDNLGQILQLTEALNLAKREIDSHSARVRELEEMFQKEREARLQAEDMMQKMEETSHARMNGGVVVPLPNGHSELDNAFDPPTERPLTPEQGKSLTASDEGPQSPDRVEAATAAFQIRIDAMVTEMQGMREQLDVFRQRAEKAEQERDVDRKTLAEMVLQIRQRDEELSHAAAERKSRSRSAKARSRSLGRRKNAAGGTPISNVISTDNRPADDTAEDDLVESPNLSRANTITPATGALVRPPNDQALLQTLPYASMIGVVLLGMGLMAYINGWQPQPRLDR